MCSEDVFAESWASQLRLPANVAALLLQYPPAALLFSWLYVDLANLTRGLKIRVSLVRVRPWAHQPR